MFLGVEIGGTKLQAGLCDTRGRVQELRRLPVDRRAGRAGILAQLRALLPPLIAVGRPRAIGIGFGGPVDRTTGRVVRSHQVDGWNRFPLRAWCAREVGLPVALENDANCAGLAEARVGAGRDRARVFYFNVGTGIGGALVIDGALFNGRFGAMELGQVCLGPRLGGGPKRLEDLASGLAIEHGVSTLRQAAECIGLVLANAITLLNPDVVVVGGGVAQAGERFLKPLRNATARWVFEPYRPNYRIVPANLGETVVVVGAALVAANGADERTSTSTSRKRSRS